MSFFDIYCEENREFCWQTEIQLFKGLMGCFQRFESRTRKKGDSKNNVDENSVLFDR